PAHPFVPHSRTEPAGTTGTPGQHETRAFFPRNDDAWRGRRQVPKGIKPGEHPMAMESPPLDIRPSSAHLDCDHAEVGPPSRGGLRCRSARGTYHRSETNGRRSMRTRFLILLGLLAFARVEAAEPAMPKTKVPSWDARGVGPLPW